MEQWKKLPVFQKAMTIVTLVDNIIKAVETTEIEFENEIEKEMTAFALSEMKTNVTIIPAKIAGASSEDMLYDIKMENATIIRKAAKDITLNLRSVEMHGFKDVEYLDLLRKELEEFRVLFAEWVKTFDQWNYTIDRWGLFNPPGVNYDDHDPDEDIPFDPDNRF